MNVGARLGVRGLRRRLSGAIPRVTTDAEFRAALEPWLGKLAPRTATGHAFLRLPTSRTPWRDTGLDLEPGEPVTLLADGRVYLSRALDLWAGPAARLWARVGARGPVFRGTRATHTFTAQDGGRLWLDSRFPGEWLDEDGRLGEPAPEFARASGTLSVLVLRWPRGVDVSGLFGEFARDPLAPALVRAEAERMAQAPATPPGWEYLWLLGPAEIFRATQSPGGRAGIGCHTHGDIGILHHEARCPLEPGTRLRWSWRVEELPIDLAEDTLPSHDYLSIGVEFDDGQDITYYWSAALPEGTVFRCPLPLWRERETHVVVRCGPAGLGRWLDEERDVHADYARVVGGAAREVVRVWLIANSMLQRGRGRCEYARIGLAGPNGSIEVL